MSKVDKRTKAYKDSLVNKKPTGLGDVVEKIATKTGAAKIVKALFGDDCGCTERKDALNAAYERGTEKHKVQRCLTEQQYIDYGHYIKTRTLDFRPNLQMLIDLYAHVFAIQYNANIHFNCSSCGAAKRLLEMQKKLDKVYNSY